jgi:type VI protein secretion system component VasK
MLARIGLEKSLFVPVIVSAVFFWYGSLINVVFNLCLQSIPNLIAVQDSINLLHQTTLLIGLSILTYGVFSYWRITRHVKIPKHERSKRHKNQQEVLNVAPAEQVTQEA